MVETTRPKCITDHFELLQLLGCGSMGQVYLAKAISNKSSNSENAEINERDKPSGSDESFKIQDGYVVIKKMHERHRNDEKFQKLFSQEIESMMGLNHPYIARFLDEGIDNEGTPCLVMEYIPGVTLDNLLRVDKRFKTERIANLLGPLTHALQYAHNRGIIHCDLKPANIMVVQPNTPNESLRVLDFGLARITSKPHFRSERLEGKLSINPSCGTPNYISPDQLRGDELDGRSDIYSVGIILFELFTGELPFPYMETQRILNAHQKQSPPPFSYYGVKNISPEIEHLVQICLSKFPAERPGSAKELAEMFSRALGHDIWLASQPVDKVKSSPMMTGIKLNPRR